MISAELRRSAIYLGDGRVKQFSFPFKIFASDQISVVALGESGADEVVDPSRYGVVLNPDQETEPGGVVEFYTAPGAGLNFVILSAVPYLQPLGLLNQGAFSAEDLNGAWDRNCILVQQLKEQIDRALLVPAAEKKTPAQLVNELLHAQNEAAQYASAASASAEEAKAVEQRLTSKETSLEAAIVNAADTKLTEISAEGDKQFSRVTEEGNVQTGRVTAEGDTQVARVTAAGDSLLWQEGLGCQEQTWNLSGDAAKGAIITIPNAMKYIVGRHHLRLSWNGLMMYAGQQFEEVGEADQESGQFKVLFDMSAGDVINAWTPALGSGLAADAIAEAQAATDAVAELSRKVVYKDEESAS